MLLGRQALWIVYQYFQTDKDNGSVYDIQDLLAIQMTGNKFEYFLNRWDTALLGLGSPLEMKMKLPLFLSKIDKPDSKTKAELNHYSRQSDGHADKTYDFLYTAMLKCVERERRKAVRESELSGVRSGAPAATATVPGAASAKATAKAKPKPKPRAKAQAGAGAGRSASPATNLGGCPYYNKGQGTCRFPDTCRYSHDHSVAITANK
eukprot:4318870-Heterocapsa_arctica.AAC.1